LADRYWVSGSGNWSDTNKWSATSGGAGGASVPTSADNVFFDANSNVGTGAFTVTVDGTTTTPSTCDDFTASGLDGTMTLSVSNTSVLDVYGSFTVPATNFVASAGGVQAQIRFQATTTGKTITTNGVDFGFGVGGFVFRFSGNGGGWTLGSALLVANYSQGGANTTFNTGNFTLTVQSILAVAATSANKVFNGGTSTITCNIFGFSDLSSAANTTFNLSSTTLNLSGTSSLLRGGGITFNNVSFTNTAQAGPSITGANTFNNLTIASRAASGIGFCSLSDNQTITGTLSVQSGNTDPTRRIRFNSDTPGTQRTITAANIDFGSGIDFQDIVAAGAASPFNVSALQGGDCKNNSNITFPAAKTVYRIGTGNFSATQWASTSGGSPAADQFPLAQDTMVFDANTTTGTHPINASYQLGTLDMTNSTTVTIASDTTVPIFYGDMTLSNAVTMSGTGSLGFLGRNTQTITSSGRTFTQNIFIDSPGTTVVLADALVSNLDMTLTRGTLDLNNQVATVRGFFYGGTNTRAITFGTGKIVLERTLISGNIATAVSANDSTNFSYTGTGLIECNYSGGSATSEIYYVAERRGNTESNAINFVFTGTTPAILFLGPIGGTNSVGTFVKNFLLNSSYTGALRVTANQTYDFYGDFSIGAGASMPAGTGIFGFFFIGTSTQNITTNGVNISRVTKNSASILRLQDNLACNPFTHTAGTVDLNGKTLTVGTDYSTSNSNVREIAFNGGTLVCQGNFTATTGTNLTTSGTGTISMTSASAKTFAGGGATYPTLNQGGAGTLTITGANTFDDITNTNPTASQITFPASTITKVKAFTLVGTSGNLVSLRSSTPGTRFNLTYEP
jgi:hypothetical protein